MGCDNDESKCPGKGWFQISCIPELKNYNLETFDTHFKKYYCPKCRELYGLKNEVNEGTEVNEINVPLNENEKKYINISINNNGNNNNLNSEEKEKENVVECVIIINNE